MILLSDGLDKICKLHFVGLNIINSLHRIQRLYSPLTILKIIITFFKIW
jgi:hypothetical protein